MIPAVLTTFLFAMSAVSAGRSTRLLGGTTANVTRLVLAGLCLAAWAHSVGQGLAGPSLPWFFLSGVIGFGMGDLALYGAYPRIGPRLGVLLCLCVAAPIGALVEWLWLGTTLTASQILWSATILIGVTLALVPDRQHLPDQRAWGTGILLGFIAALGQGLGAVLTRKGYDLIRDSGVRIDGGTSAYQRILGGLLLTFLVLFFRKLYERRVSRSVTGPAAHAWRRAWPWVIVNALSGPAIGVACFQWALMLAPTGLVLAIVATTPLMVIPLTMLIDGERPHLRSLIGGVIAVAGAAALVL
jgi:drug/metabolite transporter (DMT)-like permease